jgi:hypothetical protein
MVDSFTKKNKSTILMHGTFITFSSSQAINFMDSISSTLVPQWIWQFSGRIIKMNYISHFGI